MGSRRCFQSRFEQTVTFPRPRCRHRWNDSRAADGPDREDNQPPAHPAPGNDARHRQLSGGTRWPIADLQTQPLRSPAGAYRGPERSDRHRDGSSIQRGSEEQPGTRYQHTGRNPDGASRLPWRRPAMGWQAHSGAGTARRAGSDPSDWVGGIRGLLLVGRARLHVPITRFRRGSPIRCVRGLNTVRNIHIPTTTHTALKEPYANAIHGSRATIQTGTRCHQ